MDNDWKIRIDKPLHKAAIDVYIFRDTDVATREFITRLDTLEIHTMVAGPGAKWGDIKPAISIDYRYTESILQPLVQALVKDGIQVTEPSDKTTDELTATKYHLEDMRELIAHITELRPKLVFKRQEVKENHEF